MTSSGYWERFWRRRIGRRRFLAGLGLSASALALAACGQGGRATDSTPVASPGGLLTDGLDAVSPADARRTITPAPPDMRGGTLRLAGFEPVVLDRYDPHQTQFGPMYDNLAAVFSKLYMYTSHSEPTWENIVPDLAESAPEMIGDADEPDTYVVRLRRGVTFHDTPGIRRNFPGLAGRELTADDVVFSFDRQRNPDSPQRPYYYRSSQYETIERIEKTDDYTLRITTKGPVAPFYHFMADTNAMILPREVIDAESDTLDSFEGPDPGERMVGTGPFLWDRLVWGIEFSARSNPDWFGWGEPELGRPYLDGYSISGTGLDDATLEALFRQKRLDVGFALDNPGWVASMKEQVPELELHVGASSVWLNSRLKTDCAPFNDVRVRKALSLAADRREMIDAMWSGQGAMVGPVGAAIRYWALSDEELASVPGYRSGPQREEDIADARAAFEAAGRPELPSIWFGDQPGSLPAYTAPYTETMRRNLGAEVRTVTRAYPQIVQSFLRDCDQAEMTVAYDNGWIDLDDWVYPYFHSRGPKNSFGVSDPELDGMLEAQRREFNVERRRELGFEIQRHLLGTKGEKPAAYARLDYITAVGGSVSWPYYKNRVSFPWFGNSYWYANAWLDRSHPSYDGRPD